MKKKITALLGGLLRRDKGRRNCCTVLIAGLIVVCIGISVSKELLLPPDRHFPITTDEKKTDRDNIKNAAGRNGAAESSGSALKLGEIPPFDGNTPYIEVNENVPFFTPQEFTAGVFETYSALDSLGRCGAAYANICRELMPTEERGKIGMVKPSGWHTVKYANVDGKYLYNRCHLIGFQLAGENANVKNLITGTRYLNVEGMLPFENEVADYVRDTGHHVLYRVTPEFKRNNLLAEGVLMEAASIEDTRICFCVFVYNSQPGITIDYSDGSSKRDTGQVMS